MDSYTLIKTIHIITSTILFGTGIGTAFHGLLSNRSGSLVARRIANRNVVLADWLFTTPAVILQPLTGIWLAHTAGFPLDSGWVGASLLLYAVTIACWLPVVWIQLEMRRITDATPDDGQLPPRYRQLEHWWFALGWPAFIAMMLIFWLMVAKPSL